MPIALLIADDHELVRAGLRQTFDGSDILIVGEASTAPEALHGALDPGVQALLLDIRWTGGLSASRDAGLDVLAQIRAARPQLPILLYSTESAADCVESCRRLGANGYLIKGLDDGRLVTAVHAVHAGEQIWPSPHVYARLQTNVTRQTEAASPLLSPEPAHRALDAAPDLAHRALDAAPDAMIIIDAAGLIRFANRQASALFGYPHEQIVGRSVEDLMPERFRHRHLAHREQYARHVRVRSMGQGLELYGRRQDGTEFPVEISLSPIDNREGPLVAAAIRDVSDRKRVEAELTLARDSADRANQGKSRFLATASHDLRQPLQTLALLNGSLRRMATDPDITEALAQQEQAIGAMSRLLNALLDISKLESGAIKPEPTDFAVAALFQELRHEFTNVAANKGLQLEVEDSAVCVHSDPSLVEQVLRNLVSNAIKYTRQGRVLLRCPPLQDSMVRIQVLDTGIGIPPDQLGYIYDEFYQVGVPTSSARDGYGLGLSIVQRIIKLLQLKLDVHSEVGKGSSFSLLLPPAGGQVTAPRPESKPPVTRAQVGKAHVLLVEDDPSVRDATRMLLKVEGYRVTAVASVGEALQAARQGDRIDLLVTDYHLSDGETGTQVISALRDTMGTALKAVLITGDTSSAIRDLPTSLHLRTASKPVKAEELLALLRELLTTPTDERPPTQPQAARNCFHAAEAGAAR
ncbi:MAG TPA: response regulator [Steroidobacteraceae bacterium]|nr:response regulator [Steroidobacteraceae bacterium]